MEQTLELALNYARAAWRRRWLGMIVAWLVCVLGWAGVHFMPNIYQSSARIYVDTDAVLTPLLKGLAVDVNADQQVAILQRTLLSKPNLQTLISKTDLGLVATTPAQRAVLIRRLERKIRVTADERNLFSISYSNADPVLARDVVQTLLGIFTESATSSNRRDMQNAQQFLTRQLASYRDQLHALEHRRAQFRAEYASVLPSNGSGGIESLSSARDTVQRAELALQEAQGKETMVKSELTRLFPKAAEHVDKGGGKGKAPPPPRRFMGSPALAQAEAKLRELEAIYTDDYPGVIEQKQVVAALRKAPAGTVDASAGAGVDVGADQLYTQMTMKLLDAQVTVATAKHQAELARADLARIEKIQHERPNLLMQAQNLDRDYAVLQTNYNQLLARLQAAKLSQAADTQAEKVHLRIVDPPEVPLVPVGPNRPLLITAVLVLGILAGGASTVVFSILKPSFANADDLRSLDLPVLGSLSLVGGGQLRGGAAAVVPFAGGAILLVLAYAELIVHVLRAAA